VTAEMTSRKAEEGASSHRHRVGNARRGVREKTAGVLAVLEEQYGRHEWRTTGRPLDELIGTVLSQNTSNVNTARSFQSLRRRFPTWREVVDAPEEDVIDAIRTGGLARIKAPRIQAILRSILEQQGQLSIDYVADLPLVEAKRDLMALKGVGPKTAACVLLFSLGRPAMPVDTHVHRVSRRIGLVPERASAEAAEPILEELLEDDRDRILTAHLNLISHGQQICRSNRPRCEACRLTRECDYFQANAHRNDEAVSAG